MKPALIQQAKPAFEWRWEDCPNCWEGKVEKTASSGFGGAGGYYQVDCGECGGTGEIEQACECGEIAPLNDEGLCIDCVMPAELRAETKGQWL